MTDMALSCLSQAITCPCPPSCTRGAGTGSGEHSTLPLFLVVMCGVTDAFILCSVVPCFRGSPLPCTQQQLFVGFVADICPPYYCLTEGWHSGSLCQLCHGAVPLGLCPSCQELSAAHLLPPLSH